MVLIDLDQAHSPRSVVEHGVAVDSVYDDDDNLLDELLEDNDVPSTVYATPEHSYHEKEKTPSDNTSTTHDDEEYHHDYDSSSQERVIVYDLAAYEDDETSEISSTQSYEEEVSVDDEDDATNSVTDLLERAHDRLAMQQLQDELTRLQQVIVQKEDEVEQLSGQLRRAVSSKCDLVIAHTEMERHHEQQLAREEQARQSLTKAKTALEESKSETERELLNELVKLTDQLQHARKEHVQELEDWERLHRNEMLEKDLQIAQLTQEIRKLQGFEHSSKKKKGNGMKVVFRKN